MDSVTHKGRKSPGVLRDSLLSFCFLGMFAWRSRHGKPRWKQAVFSPLQSQGLRRFSVTPSGGTSLSLAIAIAIAKSLQSCPTLCDPIDGSPPGSPVPGILQARTLEWVAISFSNALKWKVKMKSLSRVQPSATPWTAAFQTPPSMGFSRQEYWSGVPLPSPSVLLLLTKTAVSMCTGQNGLPADRQAPSCDNTFLHLYFFFHSCLCTVSTRWHQTLTVAFGGKCVAGGRQVGLSTWEGMYLERSQVTWWWQKVSGHWLMVSQKLWVE